MGERLTLRFPRDRGVGHVWVMSSDGTLAELGPARGDLVVPAGARLSVRLLEASETSAFTGPGARLVHTLDLSGTDCRDGALVPLGRCSGLRTLTLTRARGLEGDALAALAPLWGLRRLDLSGTDTTDEGLAHLARLSSLEWLNLGGTCVAGPELAALSGMHSLRFLCLEATRTGDAALACLAALPALAELVLRATLVTPAGGTKLRDARPDCRVVGDLEENEKHAWREAWTREALAALLAGLGHAGGEEVETLLPPGTELEVVATVGPPCARPRFTLTRDPDRFERLGLWLMALPRGCSLRLTRPGALPVLLSWPLPERPPARAAR